MNTPSDALSAHHTRMKRVCVNEMVPLQLNDRPLGFNQILLSANWDSIEDIGSNGEDSRKIGAQRGFIDQLSRFDPVYIAGIGFEEIGIGDLSLLCGYFAAHIKYLKIA